MVMEVAAREHIPSFFLISTPHGACHTPPLEFANEARGQGGEMAQGQKSANVKHISHVYPLRAISDNWPSVANLSGKTSCFGLLAHVGARGVRRPLHRCSHCTHPPCNALHCNALHCTA